MLIVLGIFTSIATFLGGIFALKFKDKLHLILGFSAGAVIGLVFFELMPEAIILSASKYEASFVASIIASGFLVYLILDRTIYFRYCANEDCQNPSHKGKLGAGTLSIHSFLDGVAIGLAFQASPLLGFAIAFAVLAHDFSDGINTVSLILGSKGTKREAFRWLLADAVAPFLGVILTLFFKVSENYLGLILAVFCGFFLYIGASDLLPESHHDHPKKITTIMTVLGVGVMYLIVKLAGEI